MDRIWWNSIPSATQFIDDIASRAENDESVVYNVNNTFPWLKTFVNILVERLKKSYKVVDIVNADKCQNKSPGEYLTTKYCKPELRDKYRSSIGYDKFLASYDEATVLIDRYIIVRNCDDYQLKQWCDFIIGYNKYHSRDTSICNFIVENNSTKEIINGIINISWMDYFHRYDINMFCMLLASSIKEEDIIKSYIAELATILSCCNAELAAELSSCGKELAFNTEKVVLKVIYNKTRSDSSDFKIVNNIQSKIKETQIKLFFPEIEKYRCFFIEKLKDEFPQEIYYRTLFGEEIADVHDLELGTLKFLYDNGNISISTQDYNELKFYRDCRNKLAHTSVLNEEEIRKISKQNYVSFRGKEVYHVR